jgi:hypothetical protein
VRSDSDHNSAAGAIGRERRFRVQAEGSYHQRLLGRKDGRPQALEYFIQVNLL